MQQFFDTLVASSSTLQECISAGTDLAPTAYVSSTLMAFAVTRNKRFEGSDFAFWFAMMRRASTVPSSDDMLTRIDRARKSAYGAIS